eukprot:2393996-Karenia_brevis.AAC.1
MNPEIVMRMSSLRAAFHALEKPMLARPRVSDCSKLAVSKTVLLTRGLFQAGAWPCLSAAEARK